MVSVVQIFLVFLKIGAFTFGGGAAMIPIMRREIVARNWIGDDELTDYIAVSSSSPGMIAVNMAILVGTHLRKFWGALLAVIGVILPSLVVITLIAWQFRNFADIAWVQAALRGIKLVVIILLVFAILNIGKSAIRDIITILYALACFSVVYFFAVSPVYVILASFLFGTVQALILTRKAGKEK